MEYTIEDISPRDSWYISRDNLIGAIVTIDSTSLGKSPEAGYESCSVSLTDKESDRIGIYYPSIFFIAVKLKEHLQ